MSKYIFLLGLMLVASSLIKAFFGGFLVAAVAVVAGTALIMALVLALADWLFVPRI